jgi:uncharacterized protein
MRKFAELVLKYHIAVIVITLALTIFFGYGLTKVSINSDILSYLKNDDVVRLFNRIGADYGGNTMAMVAIEGQEIFSTPTLTTIKDLTEAYSQIPGVSSVMSLTNILDIKKTEFGLEISKLIDKYAIPSEPEALQALKTYVLNKEMYAGKFISTDGKITLLICQLQSNTRKETVAAQIHTVTEKLKGPHTTYYAGIPLQMLEVNQLLMQDLKILIPIVILVVIGTLYFSFRSLRGVILPLVTVMLATIWAVGLMGWLGVEMSVISNMMPVVLIATGTAYGIHMIAKYAEDVTSEAEKTAQITDALSEVGIPILLAGVTTLVGFLTFGGSYLTAITQFGLFSAFGVGAAMLLAITFLPAVLSFLKVPSQRQQEHQTEHHLFVKWMDALGNVVLRYEKWIVAGSLIIVVLAAFGIPRIKTEVNMIEFFPEASDIRRSDKLMQQYFGGSTPIQMLVQGDLKNPFVLKEMLRLERYLESISYVNNTQSIADLICEMNNVMNGHATIPETTEQVANLLFMLEGDDMMTQLVNTDYSEGIIQARFGVMGTQEIVSAVNAIDRYLATELDTTMKVTPITALSPDAVQQVRDFQLQRISAAIVYDAEERFPSVQIDARQIATALQSLLTTASFPLSDAQQQALKERLAAFFREEAAVLVEAEEDLTAIIPALVELSQETSIAEDQLAERLRTIIPQAYWENDPDALSSTAAFLFPILQERQYLNRTEILAQRVLPLFPAELQNQPAFRDDLRDNLWEFNETMVAFPERLPVSGASMTVNLKSIQSGMVKLLKLMNESVIQSQLSSLGLALVIVAILMMIQFKSIKIGLVVTSPIVFTILVNFAVMGYAKVPLEIASVMIASIAIGMGIDYSIHFASRFKVEMNTQPTELAAVDKTLETTGQAILINALAVALGFLVLVGSHVVPMQRFGWLITLTMVVSATAALTFLPALFLVLKRWLFESRHFPRLKTPLSYQSDARRLPRKPVINLSAGGLRLYSDEPLKKGDVFDLDLLFEDGTSLRCPVRVVWQRPAPIDAAARYDSGLRFIKLPEDTARRLAQALEQHTEP